MNASAASRYVFVRDLELPHGPEREIVLDGDHRYELNDDDTRTLAIIGVFQSWPNAIYANRATRNSSTSTASMAMSAS